MKVSNFSQEHTLFQKILGEGFSFLSCKRIGVGLFLLACLTAGSALTPSTVSAQTKTAEQESCSALGTCTCTLINVGGATSEIQRWSCTSVAGSGASAATTTTTVNPTTGTGIQETETAAGVAQQKIGGGGSCSPTSLGCWITKLPGMLFAGIALILLMLAGGILFLAGTVFNWVVIRTVYQFGTYFGTSDGMLTAWGIMRDIANIGLLFGFIFMGVLLILNVDGGGHGHGGGMSAKKAIPRLILFAVLLNFSLFASQAIIDVANAFSSTFATLAGQQCKADALTDSSGNAQQSDDDCANSGISGQILAAAGVTKIFDVTNIAEAGKNIVDQPYQYTISLILLSIFVLITAMVLLAGAIMLVIRVVVLSLLMVTSPIGFAGMAIPKLSGIASQWWSKLISQSFFAPIYLLLIFISIKLTEGLMQGSATLASAVVANQGNTAAGNIQVVMVFMIVIGFMIASLMVASKMGAMGASFAANTASAVTFGAFTRGTNLIAGGSAYAARRAIQKSGVADKGYAKVAVNRVLRPLEKMNLDPRRAGVGAILGAAGISAGAKPAEHATFGDLKHKYEDARDGKKGKDLEQEYQGEMKRQNLEKEAHDGTLTAESQQYLASLSTKQLEELHGIKEGVAAMAQNLTPEQFEGLMKSDKLDEGQKGVLRNGRFEELKSQLGVLTDPGAAAADKKTAKAGLRRWSAKDLAELAKSSDHADLLSSDDFAANISEDQFDAVVKNDKLTRVQQGGLRTARDNRFDAAHALATLGGMSVEDVGKLKSDIVSQGHVFTNMSGRQLAAIDPSKLDPAQLGAIAAHIRSLPPGAPVRSEFSALLTANPKVSERWAGYI